MAHCGCAAAAVILPVIAAFGLATCIVGANVPPGWGAHWTPTRVWAMNALIWSATLVAWIVAVLLLASSPAAARWYAIDGDTLVNGATHEHIRLENADAPELKGACPAERELAQRAKAFAVAALEHVAPVIHRIGRVDKYGRTLALVEVPGRGDLGELLIAAGLAREYHGGKRKGWC